MIKSSLIAFAFALEMINSRFRQYLSALIFIFSHRCLQYVDQMVAKNWTVIRRLIALLIKGFLHFRTIFESSHLVACTLIDLVGS